MQANVCAYVSVCPIRIAIEECERQKRAEKLTASVRKMENLFSTLKSDKFHLYIIIALSSWLVCVMMMVEDVVVEAFTLCEETMYASDTVL